MKEQERPSTERVLVVDDAGIVRLACERALRRAGFEVRTADSGESALFILDRWSAEAVLLDLRMPVMSGLDVIRVIRERWPRTEIVAMTAYPESLMVAEMIKHGALAVITKPFENIYEVVRIVGRAAARSRIRENLPVDSAALLRLILVGQHLVPGVEFEESIKQAATTERNPREAVLQAGWLTEAELEQAVAVFLEEQS